jgi:hypothetical protein
MLELILLLLSSCLSALNLSSMQDDPMVIVAYNTVTYQTDIAVCLELCGDPCPSACIVPQLDSLEP